MCRVATKKYELFEKEIFTNRTTRKDIFFAKIDFYFLSCCLMKSSFEVNTSPTPRLVLLIRRIDFHKIVEMVKTLYENI